MNINKEAKEYAKRNHYYNFKKIKEFLRLKKKANIIDFDCISIVSLLEKNNKDFESYSWKNYCDKNIDRMIKKLKECLNK